MKTIIAKLIAAAFSAAAAYGYVYELYDSWPTPGPNPRGFCLGAGAYCIVQDGSNPVIYIIGYSGSIISSFPCPGGPGAWGITVDYGNYFYITNHDTSWIYKTTTTGSLISSFASPVAHPADLCYRNSSMHDYLHVAFPDENYIGLLDTTTGSLVSTLAGPGTEPTACGPNTGTWFVADAGTGTIYEFGAPVATGIGAPTGFDSLEMIRGPYTAWFYVVDDATDSVRVYWNVTAVGPASLGRIKALYR